MCLTHDFSMTFGTVGSGAKWLCSWGVSVSHVEEKVNVHRQKPMLDFILGLFESHYYSTLHHLIVVIHVLGALIALIVAPTAMVATKGGRTHILWGRVYFWAMFVTN